MKIIKGLEKLKPGGPQNVVLTIGNFDGVHLGHQKTLKRVVEAAGRLGCASMAMTFEPHPSKVLSPERGVRILTPPGERARLMAGFGLDSLLIVNFDRRFAGIRPDEFIQDVLVEKIGIAQVMVGQKYAFGKGRKGTTELLRRRGRKFGFQVRVVRNATVNGDVVSSSRIRGLIARGRVCEASMFLGRPYMIAGTVIKGAGRGGKLLQVPTANISTSYELVPKQGVYAVKVKLRGREYGGAANIGSNPTFGASGPSYEVHVLDFSGDVLGRDISLHFVDRIRDEMQFPSAVELKGQIAQDIKRAREILKRKKHWTI